MSNDPMEATLIREIERENQNRPRFSDTRWKVTRVKEGYLVKAASTGCVLARVHQFPLTAQRAAECQFNASLMGAAPTLFAALDPELLETVAAILQAQCKDSRRAPLLRDLAKRQRAAIERATRGVK
jgi:hypothetical protein